MNEGMRSRSAVGRSLRLASLALLSLALLSVVSGLTLTARGRHSLEESDAAFHRGDLRRSIAEAREAALAYVPGAQHVTAAYARLEAIARGAESEGDEALARIAWDTLRVVIEQTDYPGRPPSEALERAQHNLERLERAAKSDASEMK